MAVLHDWECSAHGRFEAFAAHCPHGCGDSMVHKVFIQAPGLHSARTTNIDRNLRALANDYGLTNMNNQNGTSAAVRPDARKEAARNELMGKLGDTSHAWGQIPTGASGIGQALSAHHAAADNALASIKPILQAPKPLVVARHDAKLE